MEWVLLPFIFIYLYFRISRVRLDGFLCHRSCVQKTKKQLALFVRRTSDRTSLPGCTICCIMYAVPAPGRVCCWRQQQQLAHLTLCSHSFTGTTKTALCWRMRHVRRLQGQTQLKQNTSSSLLSCAVVPGKVGLSGLATSSVPCISQSTRPG